MEEVCNDHRLQSQGKSNAGGGGGGGSNSTNGPHTDPTPLKSNLKKTTTTTVEVINQPPRIGTRKVNWPDAHGKDIAHVQEFDPSFSEEGELGGVQNSCVCAIQ